MRRALIATHFQDISFLVNLKRSGGRLLPLTMWKIKRRTPKVREKMVSKLRMTVRSRMAFGSIETEKNKKVLTNSGGFFKNFLLQCLFGCLFKVRSFEG